MEANLAPQFPSSSSQSFDSGDTGTRVSINGLRKPNYFKIFRNDLIQLTNYVFLISPPLKIVHKIMTVIRIMQFMLPCLIPAYFTFWEIGSVDQVVVDVISVLYCIVPPTTLFKTAHILLIIYEIIQLLVIFIVIGSSFYFKRHAKLPAFIPFFIYFYQITFGHYFHPVILYTIFEGFSYLTLPNVQIQITIISFIFLILVSLICIAFNFFFMIIITGQSLIFRPNSLASTTSDPPLIIFLTTILINIFFGIASNLQKKYQYIFLFLNVILYVISAFSVFYKGGYIKLFTSNFVLSSSITGAVFTICDIIFIMRDIKGSIAIIFAIIIFFVLMLTLCYFILQHLEMKKLKQLDSIEADKSLFSFIKTPNQFLQIAVVGIKYAHPIIIDKSFFTLGIERWKKNQYVYFIYAKFVSIYPEETVTLKYIYKSVKMSKLYGSAAMCIREQTRQIMKHREAGLSQELKNKISRIRKQNQSTKHKLGHVWDVVIRGNLNEIEVATKRAIESINETNVDIQHLLHEFPNNRNVSYFYSIFLNDVMADHVLSHEMHERTKQLLPGVTIIEDQAHEFALKEFPNLPSSIKVQNDQVMMSSTVEASQSFMPNYEKDKQKDIEQISGICENIRDLNIPSILWTKAVIVVTFLLFFFIPCIGGLIYINFFIKKLQEPLNFIGSLSLLRTYAYQVIGFSLRYVGENMTVFPKINPNTKNPPDSFGGSWNTRSQLEHLLSKTTNALQEFNSFRMFEENNPLIQQAQSLIFQNTVPYSYYISPTNMTTTMISISGAILDYTIQQKMILTGYGASASTLSSGTILNPLNNAYPITVNIHNALNLMIQYINENYKNTKKIGILLIIILVIVEFLVFFITLAISIKWINSNKIETYQCLFSLPKNIVSELSENRESKKKDNQPEEMNKQNENILKIFNSGGTSNDSFSDVFLLIFGTTLIVIFACACIVIFAFLVTDLTRIVRNAAPHLHYLLASYSMLLSSLNWFHVILFEFGGHPIPTVNFSYSYGRMEYVMERSRYFYHLISAGGPSNQEVPFHKFIEGIRNASPKNCTTSNTFNISTKKLADSDFNVIANTVLKSSFNSLTKVLECSPVDMTFTLIEPIILYSISPYRQGEINVVDPKSPAYQTIWQQMISPLYDLFFEPLHNQIIPTIIQDLKDKKSDFIPYIVASLIIATFIEIILFYQVKSIENHIRSVLNLLLHCNPSVIFSSAKISRILTGDFSSQQNDSLDRNNSFFDIVFTSLPDAIMYANADMIIQSANEACKLTFGDVVLIGQSIKDFFLSSKFSGNTENLFTSVNQNPIEEISYKSETNSELILKATSMIACGKFVICCKNVTQSHNYNNLILEEKQNSDKLLSTILPPSLVTRVQEGEKNISFSVQSASILFSDIVSFTPWCGSLPAEKVMSTLNILFKRLDSILDTKHTMTKIKCIGDCYMAAGGIFSEINQPSVHAKEVVSFGLLSIKEVLLIDEEINQNLKIRVGVNTGGPIVAGVLGIGKPTFEILGPAINRAQQMEQNGVPMKVHISIDVYELICSFNFKFCNRRTIECKNGQVETYLVEP